MLNVSANGLNVDVLESPATDESAGSGQPLTSDQRLKMLQSLSPENLELVIQFIEAISPQKPESASGWQGKQETPVNDPEPRELPESELLERYRALSPERRAEVLQKGKIEAAKDNEMPDYLIAQIVMPMALSVLKNVIDPMDLFNQKYSLTEFADWMADELPKALTGCDVVALAAYLKAS